MSFKMLGGLFLGALLIVAFFILPQAQVFAQSPPPLSTTGNPKDIKTVRPLGVGPPPVNCAVDAGKNVVALDTSNGGSWGDHTTLLADLLAQGFTVRIFNIVTDGIPACIVQMFITSGAFGGCLTGIYSAAEVTLIKNWVIAGGRLHLQNEFDGCGVGTAPIANAFDETWDGSDYSQVFVSGVNYNPSNPSILWAGVGSWQVFAASTYTAANGVVARTTAGNPAMIAEHFGSGCIVKVGDYDWSQDSFIASNGNRQLATNVFIFLNSCGGLTVNLVLKTYKIVNVLVQVLQGSMVVASRTVTLTYASSTASFQFQSLPSGAVTVKISGYSIAIQTQTTTPPAKLTFYIN